MKKTITILFGFFSFLFCLFIGANKVSAYDFGLYRVTSPEFTMYQPVLNEDGSYFSNTNISNQVSFIDVTGYESKSSTTNHQSIIEKTNVGVVVYVYLTESKIWLPLGFNLSYYQIDLLSNERVMLKDMVGINYMSEQPATVAELFCYDHDNCINLNDAIEITKLSSPIYNMFSNPKNYVTDITDTIYDKGYEQGKIDGIEEGKNSVDITIDNQEVYNQGFNDGQTSVDITVNDEEIWNEAYKEGMDDGLVLGFEDGKNSIDLEQIKQEEYNRGYDNGYNLGFVEGESSVDITSDNDTVIDAYITVNKYHTNHEFNLNYEKGYNAGINFIYENIENDTVIQKYVIDYVTDYIIVNEYKTKTEYVDNYNDGYNAGYNSGYNDGVVDGKETIYKNVESDPIIKEYWKTKLVNGTVINITNKGNEIIEVVKNYDVNYDSDDDLVINIHNGQDKYHVETVEEVVPGVSTTKEKIVFDYELLRKAIVIIVIGAVGLIFTFLIGSIIFAPKVTIRKRRKAGNGYVWKY